MAWTDRLREAAYRAPSGTRAAFIYEDVSRGGEKKTTAFEFPDANGTYVQDLGHTGRRYPLRVFFWGANCDLEAAAFEDLLFEQGPGVLEHPLYGQVDVVPFGAINRRDDLKTAANQAVIEVTFWETIGIVYPSGQLDPASAVLSSVDAYNSAAAANYAEVVSVDTAVERATLRAQTQALLDSVSSAVSGVVAEEDSVRAQFEAINDSINAGIDTLISDPLTLAFQTVQLIEAPARSSAAISDRLSAYSDLAASIIGADATTDSNIFRTRDLYASSYTSASVVSVVNNQFSTRSDAIAAAEAILDLFDQVNTWRDGELPQQSTLEGQIDTGGAYQRLQEAVSLAAGYLVYISFSLKQEKSITLDRARTIIDLAAELYGSVDDMLDFLIDSNDLTGDEILELPRGREIVYYI